jgi:hypothetical protein
MAVENGIFADNFWLAKAGGRFLIYHGPYLQQTLSVEDVAKFVRKKGAMGALWSYDYDNAQEGPWYRYICDTIDYKIESIKKKKGRYYIRKGLDNCVVKPISYLWLADNGYDVYLNASARYTNFQPVSKENYSKQMRDLEGKDGREALGVFVDEKLAAYATLILRYPSVLVAGSKFDPRYSESYPMYALYYTIVHHYLKERGFKKIDNGTSPLYHDTNIGDFLLRLGWRKEYCWLEIYLVWPLSLMLRLAGACKLLCRVLLPAKYFSMIESLLLAQQISKATKTPLK